MEADDKTRELWVRTIKSRMYFNKYLLAISLTIKLNLCLMRIRLVTILPMYKCSHLKHYFSITTSDLYIT